jgi:hypothetical protein
MPILWTLLHCVRERGVPSKVTRGRRADLVVAPNASLHAIPAPLHLRVCIIAEMKEKKKVYSVGAEPCTASKYRCSRAASLLLPSTGTKHATRTAKMLNVSLATLAAL